jgi:hypothetical protein
MEQAFSFCLSKKGGAALCFFIKPVQKSWRSQKMLAAGLFYSYNKQGVKTPSLWYFGQSVPHIKKPPVFRLLLWEETTP